MKWSLFTALPGGYRNYNNGTFNNIGNNGNWWSATESGSTSAWTRGLHYGNSDVRRSYYRKRVGFSVWLVRD